MLDQLIKRFKNHACRGQRGRLAGLNAAEEIELGEAHVTSRNGAAAMGEVFANGQAVQLKEFKMEPTGVYESAAQMQFRDHDLYTFLDFEANKHSSLYLRGTGITK